MVRSSPSTHYVSAKLYSSLRNYFLLLHYLFFATVGNSGSDTRSEVEAVIDRSRNRMGVAILDMVQIHWYVIRDVSI